MQSSSVENNEQNIAKHNNPAHVKGWISVKDQLPEFDVEVLMYQEIETSDEGVYPYIEIGCVSGLIQTKNYAEAEWIDKEYNRRASPSHWMPLPAPPVER